MTFLTSRITSHRLAQAALLVLSTQLPLAVHAHMTWILPNQTQLSGKEPVVSVDAAVSEDLFSFERGLKLDAVVITGPDGAAVAAENRSSARHRDSFDVKLVKDGTYRISNVSQSLMASYKQGSETKRFRGTVEAFAKEVPADAEVLSASITHSRQQTFVSKEDPGTPAFAPEGRGLELLPLGVATDLSDGDNTRFRLLLDGKPLPDATVKLLRDGNRYRYKLGELTLKTDAKGEFSVQWSEPGRYWLGASYPARAAAPAVVTVPSAVPPAGSGGTRDKPLQRASLSATFEVLPK
ncbi:MAG TPA: DUF4198 domain-containing protein [Burkholderiaceae bacterium]